MTQFQGKKARFLFLPGKKKRGTTFFDLKGGVRKKKIDTDEVPVGEEKAEPHLVTGKRKEGETCSTGGRKNKNGKGGKGSRHLLQTRKKKGEEEARTHDRRKKKKVIVKKASPRSPSTRRKGERNDHRKKKKKKGREKEPNSRRKKTRSPAREEERAS